MTGSIADIHRIAVWSTTGPDAVAVRRLVQHLRRQGFDAAELTPRRPLPDDVDMIVAVGDPTLAADHALAARRPLLATQTAEQAAEALAAPDALIVQNHLMVRIRADKVRRRVVFATAQITPLDTRGALTVETAGRLASGLSAGLATSDPFNLLAESRHRPDRPILRVEEATRHWGPTLAIDHRAAIIVRSARPGTHLRVVSDAGRHAGLASTLEIGPTVQLALVCL